MQQARSVLLKALNSSAEAESSPLPIASEQSVPTATPLTVESAYALLGVQESDSQAKIQQAYQYQLQQLDSAIDQNHSAIDAEPLWEQHKRVQQARYLLLRSRSTAAEMPQNNQHSKKLVHACALLAVNADSSEPVVRSVYNKKIRDLEEAIDAARSPQQEDQLFEQQRQLQRAFAIFAAAQTVEKTNNTGLERSPHQGLETASVASLGDFLLQQKRQKIAKSLFKALTFFMLLAATYLAWQKGYLHQAKDWLLPPLSPAQLALQEPVLQLQAEVQQLRAALEAEYEGLRLQALEAAHADSADYPRLVRLRNSYEKTISKSQSFGVARQQQEQAALSLEQQDYIAAESPLLDARASYQALQLKSVALLQGKKPQAKLKRRIPSTPKKTVVKTAPKPVLPPLNAAQRLLMPVLVDVPAGQFMMGDKTIDDAQPVHSVTLSAFKMGESEVSVKHFRQFVQQTKYQTEAERNVDEKGCSVFSEDSKSWLWRADTSWQNPGFEQGEEDPVVCLSWADVQAYLNWLRGATGWNMRLASEAEWEYAVRAGTTSAWFWGDKLGLERANCEDCNQDWEVRQTFASRAYPANTFGLHSMPGNVWEWLQDCWQDDYKGAPDNGQARLNGNCAKRAMRGGSWFSPGRDLRSGARNASSRLTYRSSSLGFRIVLSH